MITTSSMASDLVLESDGNIFTIGLDGSDKTYLTDDGPGYDLAAWSYDGSKIVYVHQAPNEQSYIWTMNADGSDKQQLTSGLVSGAFPTFSPDGTSILFTAIATGTSELWLMGADGTNPHPITDTTGSQATRFGTTIQESTNASYSPDGTRIAYTSTESGRSEIWVMNADGSGQTQLTFPNDPNSPDANAASWSPDGSKIAFWSGFVREFGNIYTMNPDGSDRTQLTPGNLPAGVPANASANSDNPSWLSGGKYILFDSNLDGPLGAYIMNADGTGQRLLLSDPHGASRLPITGGSETIWGGAGDTITGSSVSGTSQLIDATGTNALVVAGPMTIIGGAGPTTVWASSGDGITGGAGTLLAAGNKANNMTIVGGTGNLTTFNFGTGNRITGSMAGTTFIDDNYGGSGNTIGGGAGSTTVIGGPGDLITGGAGAMLLNALNGGSTIAGGGGPTTIWGGANQSITGGAGALLMAGNAAAGETIVGGAGNLFAFNLGKNNSVVGSAAGTSFIDDSYGGGGSDTLTGGAGNSTIISGSGDSISGGTGALETRIGSNLAGIETVNLSMAAAGVRDISVSGGTGATVSVTGFSNNSSNVIESATSVNASNVFQGSSASSGGNTTLTFLDGTSLTLVGVASVGAIKFTQ